MRQLIFPGARFAHNQLLIFYVRTIIVLLYIRNSYIDHNKQLAGEGPPTAKQQSALRSPFIASCHTMLQRIATGPRLMSD